MKSCGVLSHVVIMHLVSYWMYHVLGIISNVCTNLCTYSLLSTYHFVHQNSESVRCYFGSSIPWNKMLNLSSFIMNHANSVSITSDKFPMFVWCVAHQHVGVPFKVISNNYTMWFTFISFPFVLWIPLLLLFHQTKVGRTILILSILHNM